MVRQDPPEARQTRLGVVSDCLGREGWHPARWSWQGPSLRCIGTAMIIR